MLEAFSCVLLWRSACLLRLVLLFLLQDVGEVNELLHGFHLPAEVLEVHAAGPAVSLQQQSEPLAHSFVVHFRPASEQQREE